MKRITTYLVGLARFLTAIVLRRPDVVHIHVSVRGSFFRKCVVTWLSILFRIPVVLHVHGSDFHDFYDRSATPIQSIIRQTLTKSDMVIALGAVWAARLSEIAPKADIISVANAVRPKTAIRQPALGEPVNVLFLGIVGDRKGTFTLLRAWAARPQTDDVADIRSALTVAGDGEIDRAKELVRDLGIGDTVTVHGWVSPTEVPALIEGAQILVLPSQNEGQPMAVLEAMANGLCVITTPVGGIPDLVDTECGVLVPVDDVDALSKALDEVVRDEALRVRLGNSALDRVRNDFDADVAARTFDRLYRELAGITV
ncbi:glycosyltransferase family 4 protein [Antrihabitans cavernicola]|nr:glycosyltransferase family 4 protein [Spelaeibacter cavernicola]